MKPSPALRPALAAVLAALIFPLLPGADRARGEIDPYAPPRLAVKADNHPEVILSDKRVRMTFGPERLVIEGGLQPSMVITRTGAVIVQSQVPRHSFPSKRWSSHWAMATAISRDGGEHWTDLPLRPGENGLNLEGGGVQLRDGTLLALDTYVTPGTRPGEGEGQLYLSRDDWRTLEGPITAVFHIPGADFTSSSDDGGRPNRSLRLHRRILEMPNGDLLTTLYGQLQGDHTPAPYMPTMFKTRVMLLRSADRGRHWDLVSTVAVDPAVGTEGYDEAVLGRINAGARAGRLVCLMRTGRELREAVSDDAGRTWSRPYPRVFADLDVYRTERWTEMFRGVRDRKGGPLVDNPVEMVGAVVDPDLVVLRSGLMVASFGLRVPPRACWPRAGHPLNGSYLAVSLDQGATWSQVVRMTSGVLTTHYTAIEEAPPGNRLFLAYDLGDWRSGQGRSTYGRSVTIALASK